MRRIVFIALTLLGSASLAAAQIPTAGNVFVGYSYYNNDIGLDRKGLNGWEGSLEGKLIPFVPWIGIVADFSANYGELRFGNPGVGTCAIGVVCGPTTANAHVDNLLFGPRISVSVGKVRPFAEGLVGLAHVSTHGFGNDTSISSGVGGGIDYKLIPLVAWRFEGDYLHTKLFNVVQNNVKLSTGIVIRF